MEQLKLIVQDLIKSYEGSNHIYTDGSKSESGVWAAAVMEGVSSSGTLPTIATIFTAELHGLSKTLRIANEAQSTNITIFSDSQSAIASLIKDKTENTLKQKILRQVDDLRQVGKKIAFSWVPGHVGAEGNEWADKLAKRASKNVPQLILIPYRDWYPEIRKKTMKLGRPDGGNREELC